MGPLEASQTELNRHNLIQGSTFGSENSSIWWNTVNQESKMLSSVVVYAEFYSANKNCRGTFLGVAFERVAFLLISGFSFHGGGQTPHMFSTPLSDCPLGKKESDGIKSNAKSLERGSCQLF